MKSGELNSWLETTPVLSQNNCGALNVSEVEIKPAARRRVRKSRGEQPTCRQNKIRDSKTLRSNNFAVRMSMDYEPAMKVELQDPAPKGASIVKAFGTPKRRALIRIDLSSDTKPARTEICWQPEAR
jgi:hypothetical protein